MSAALLVLWAWFNSGCASTDDDAGDGAASGPAESGGYELVIVDGSDAGVTGQSQRPPDTPTTAVDAAAAERRRDDDAGVAAALPGAVAYDRDGEYTVQIGIHDSARTARERVLELSELGYPAYALGIRGDSRVRVRIGYFSTREEAERFGQIFKEDTGSDYWVDRRVTDGT